MINHWLIMGVLFWLVVGIILKHMSSSIGRIIPHIMENKKCYKPPTSIKWGIPSSWNRKTLKKCWLFWYDTHVFLSNHHWNVYIYILLVSLFEQIFDAYCCYCFKPKTYSVVCLVLWNVETIVGMLIVGYASL